MAPLLPPLWRRLFAHVIRLQLGCPRCGRLTELGRYRARQGAKRSRDGDGYDPQTATFTCKACGGRWYVGVVLWPATHRKAIPEDHVPTPRQAAQMRAELSGETDWPVRGVTAAVGVERARPRINLVCICGERCPVHQVEGAPVGAPEKEEE